jgi:hypothetical protein
MRWRLGAPIGGLYGTVQKAIDVWSSFGRVRGKISSADVIARDIWVE